MTQLILTQLWIDHGLLLANDKNHGLLVLTTESVFKQMNHDSLQRNWTLSSGGMQYRKIRGQKRCYMATSIEELKRVIQQPDLHELVQASHQRLSTESGPSAG